MPSPQKSPQSLGGKARAEKLPAATRSEIARNAALAKHAPKLDPVTG